MIYVDENKASLCKGDFHPAALYKGDKKIAGYSVEEFSGEGSVMLENCYNDKLHNAQIIGNSIQDGTPIPETPVEIQSVGELVTEGEYAEKYKIPVTARGKNLIDKSNIKITRDSCRLYEKNGDLITIQGNEGAAAGASSAGALQFTFPETLPSGKYTFSMHVTLLEEGMWGTEARIYAGPSVDKYSEKLFFYSNNTVGVRKRIEFTGTFSNGLGTVTMRLNGNKWLVDISSLQIEKGSEVTDYEPYTEPQTFDIYLDEPLRKIGEYEDYIDFDKGVVLRNVEKLVFDGTEAWEKHSTKNLLNRGQNKTAYLQGSSGEIRALSSHLVGVTWDSLYKNLNRTDGELLVGVSSTQNSSALNMFTYVCPYSTSITVAEWKAQLADWYEKGNPFTVWYVIPTKEEAINLPKIPTFKGTTVLEIESDVSVTISGKYKRQEEEK